MRNKVPLQPSASYQYIVNYPSDSSIPRGASSTWTNLHTGTFITILIARTEGFKGAVSELKLTLAVEMTTAGWAGDSER